MTEQVFVSYSHRDQEFVSQLVFDLGKRGAQVWVNREDIRASALWKESVAQSIRACKVVMIVVSLEFEATDWAFRIAVETKKPIIPLFHGKANILGNREGFLDSYQHVDFGQGSYEENIGRLVAELAVYGIELAAAEIPIPSDSLKRYRAWRLGMRALVRSGVILRKIVDWALLLALGDSVSAAKRLVRYWYVLMIFVPFVWILYSAERDWQQLLFCEAVLVMGVIYYKLGIAHVARKRQVFEAGIRESAKSDPRGFFLLLRSFTRIEPYETRGGLLHIADTNIPRPYRSILPDLAKAISDVGALVYLEQKPIAFDYTGYSWTAIRVQSKNEGWQEVFHNLADACRAIILLPGDTHGSTEEILFIMANGLWHKTFVLIPPIVGLDSADWYHRSKGGWTDDVDEGIRMDKQEAWDDLQTHLAKSGIKLPAFDTNGYFYLPDTDFSVRRKVAFDPGAAEMSQQIRQAFREVLSLEDFPGRPVMDIFGLLDRIECEARNAEISATSTQATGLG